MSTKCNQTIRTPHQEYQVHREIQWLLNKCIEVEEEMKKRPSKIRHLNDLKRQIKEREEILERHRQGG